MHKIRTLFWISLLVVGVASLAVACGGEAEPVQPSSVSGAELLRERCTECHSLDRVQAASKGQAEWEATVDRMRGKGAELTDEEAQILTEHLGETYGQ